MPNLPISPTLLAITVLQGAGAVLLLSSILIVTTALGPETYGRYAWVVAGGGILALIAQRGLPTTIVKRFSPLNLTSADAAPVARTATLFWLASAISTIAVFVYGEELWPFARPEAVWMVPIGLGLASVAISDAILRAADKGLRANISSQLVRPGLMAGVALILLLNGIADQSLFLLLYAASGLFGAAIFLGYMPLLVVRHRKAATPVRTDHAHYHVSIARSVSNFLPVFIAGFLLPPEQVAYLAIAIQLTAPLEFGLAASRAHYGAKINGSIKSADFRNASAALGKAALFSRFVAIVGALAVGCLLYGLAHFELGPMKSFDDVYLLACVFVAVGMAKIGFAAFGPVQLVAIMLHDETRVRALTLGLTVCFALALALSAKFGTIVACAAVMPIYAFALTLSLRQRVKQRFVEHKRVPLED